MSFIVCLGFWKIPFIELRDFLSQINNNYGLSAYLLKSEITLVF